MRRPLLLLGLVGAVLAAVRRARSARAERDLWTEATAPPDLR